jgi:hypothetical protein
MAITSKETKDKGDRFRSRLEARWAVFFDTLGLKWWYEPEGFDLHFDYEEFAKDWDFTEEELLEEGIPQALKALDGKKYSYLPDFYLPELNYWIEIKGPLPTKADLLKAFFLSGAVNKAAGSKVGQGETEKENKQALRDAINVGVYVFYGDIPWPFPEGGNAVGYGVRASGSPPLGPERLWGRLRLSWQQCHLCSKIGIDTLGEAFCQDCKFEVEKAIYARTGAAEAIGLDLAKARRTHSDGLWLEEMSEESLENVIQAPLAPKGQETARSRVAREHMRETMKRHRLITEALNKHDRLVQEALNLEFFTTGHKTPNLQKAYDAARSARFEHGDYPLPPH